MAWLPGCCSFSYRDRDWFRLWWYVVLWESLANEHGKYIIVRGLPYSLLLLLSMVASTLLSTGGGCGAKTTEQHEHPPTHSGNSSKRSNSSSRFAIYLTFTIIKGSSIYNSVYSDKRTPADITGCFDGSFCWPSSQIRDGGYSSGTRMTESTDEHSSLCGFYVAFVAGRLVDKRAWKSIQD